MEREIANGPRLSLALRARRGLMILGAALGLAAAGATTAVGTQRGAQSAHLSMTLPPQLPCRGSLDEFLNWCGEPRSWWEFPPEKSPHDSPPTAMLETRRRPMAPPA